LEEAQFFKALGGLFTEFATKVQKLTKKQEGTRIQSYPSGSLHNATWGMVETMKKAAIYMGEFGSSMEDVVTVLNSTHRSRTSERQKVFQEFT